MVFWYIALLNYGDGEAGRFTGLHWKSVFMFVIIWIVPTKSYIPSAIKLFHGVHFSVKNGWTGNQQELETKRAQ